MALGRHCPTMSLISFRSGKSDGGFLFLHDGDVIGISISSSCLIVSCCKLYASVVYWRGHWCEKKLYSNFLFQVPTPEKGVGRSGSVCSYPGQKGQEKCCCFTCNGRFTGFDRRLIMFRLILLGLQINNYFANMYLLISRTVTVWKLSSSYKNSYFVCGSLPVLKPIPNSPQ